MVADPNVVMLYNDQQEYRRELLSERGDECEWIAVGAELLANLAGDRGADVRERASAPFRAPAAACSARAYWRQRRIFARLAHAPEPEPLWVQERAVAVLGPLVRGIFGCAPDGPARGATRRAHHDAVEAARLLLARRFRERLTLAEFADAADLSIFHFCRLFRATTGFSIHQYQQELRLRWSLERLPERGLGLTQLAFEAGFSSHSHFTRAFARTFGCPPSRARNGALARRLARNRKILTA